MKQHREEMHRQLLDDEPTQNAMATQWNAINMVNEKWNMETAKIR